MAQHLASHVVFFDLDDTLCDTIGCRPERARKAFARLCQDHPQLELDQLVARALEPTGEARSARGVEAVLEELGLTLSAAGIAAREIFVTSYESLRLFPEVEATLRRLGAGYTLGLISNGQEQAQRAKLAYLGLDGYFALIVTSAAAGYTKPDPRIFSYALERAGAEAAEAVFVGDRLDVDVGGAKAAGLRAVWFNHWGGRLDAGSPQPDGVITHFAELPAALARLM